MFFSGDPSTRRRVDLGGRSSKERDRQKLLEQTRLERNRRLWLRLQNSAAIKIQKCFRGRKVVEAERCIVRENFLKTYGERCHSVDRQCFRPDSGFLRHLLFFFNPTYTTDVSVLVETCRLLLEFVRDTGDVVSLFAGTEYASNNHVLVVRYRVKKFVHACIRAVYGNRNKLRDQLFVESAILLLDAVKLLIDSSLPWACSTVTYLLQGNIYSLFREIVLIVKDRSCPASNRVVSSFECVIALISSHIGQSTCTCPSVDPQCCFLSQVLTIPFLWQFFPHLKEIFASSSVSRHYFHHMTLCMKGHVNVLPPDIAIDLPGYACLLGNLLEVARLAFAQPEPFTMAVDFATAATFLLEALPSLQSSNMGSKEMSEDEMVIDDEQTEKVLNLGLEQQITNAIDPRFLLQLTTVLLGGFSPLNGSYNGQLDEKHVAAVTAVCAFLHATFNILPLERIMTVLAYRTELVPVLWNFMKQCHENQKWSSLSAQSPYLPADAPGWLIPLSVFCPVYKHMLMIVDNEEFYEQEKPLSLKDIRCLIVILRQALWQLLWLNPTLPANFGKSANDVFAMKKHPLEFLQHRVCVVASELLSQLQDWNNRRQFTLPSEFHADGVNEYFISQATMENTRANDILKQAPFLVPFTSRAKIFTSQLAAVRERNGSQGLFARHRFRIRRDHILEDAFNQLNALSEEDLRGLIRVTFVNELGVEEAGIDGGGIFKDFMENITRAAFDVQYGLFKATEDHLLYPNPGSGLIHDQHLQYFHFLGTVLAKAMFEGILVDIPFATFFLSKLKQKYNYLNDLPSLDPELYRHLIFLKHYEGDVSDLELYFVIVNNEYGEQTEEELLPGGKSIRVTNENVITFIHLIANHRLNFQIRQQSSHFLRGFQQLIQKEWIDMFNEHELQLLISGSLDGIDIDDLRAHTNYTGGYHKEHYVVDMFWEVVKNLSLENQRKFLKFVTGCSRGPLLGFKYLEPLFCIQRAGGNASEEALDRLPTSATCMNLLKFPPYRSKEQMEQKLLYAINADAGFDLS
ncbi:E3 ubiquitin-protein ligase UPL6 [Capsicum annuum]|uniref:HECT-type E3 ubiquitin transferase n=2 Tax=Capsicum annuum TaxID=4072 RepID=A0A2G2XTF7_CAPAN|nr:E3 ubiquitin-protein ligase UPL6 [Capsicum annuum]KAF3684962.1 E3 ubiquitin-protein ligase UPL6 [Capsicum annuum]PHT60768.1 E3 ubiquitin-protein ligase UPL6 [Capsicum annuum]PHT93447.1 E3 ubiquitin-protein ligase UPL6 [Capsicum annuum]